MDLRTGSEASEEADSLLCRAINNDHEALNELFARYRSRLYHALLRLLRNPDDAEDALQDGLLAAFRNLSGFEGRSQFSTWLTRIVINAGLMRLRRRLPELITSFDQQLDPGERSWADSIRDSGPNPEEIFGQQERLRILEQKLRALPTLYRQAVQLCDVEGNTTREAAEVLGIRTGSLKTRLHRARLRLLEHRSVCNHGSPHPRCTRPLRTPRPAPGHSLVATDN